MTTLDRAERAVAVVAVAALAGIGFLALVFGIPTASTTAGTGMMGGGMMGGMGGVPFVLFPFMFLTLAAFLALGYVGVRALAKGDESGRVDEAVDDEAVDPIARLKRRYTEGELTEAEFERALERELEGQESVGDGDAAETAAEASSSVRER